LHHFNLFYYLIKVGAAIVGRKLKYQQIKITEVLCRSIGIGLYTGVITYLLFRNSSLPCVGGCVYSTLVDDQETMVLDVYEGERPHVKFCRYLGEVTILGLPRGAAGKVKCELYLKMNHEGLLEVNARDLNSGKVLETVIDANPEHLSNNEQEVNSGIELDPIEAERYKKPDYDFVYQLETLDEYLEELGEKYRNHQYSKFILDKIFDTKEWLYKNRRTIKVDECYSIRYAINKFLRNMETLA
jgi:heat shock protein 5